MLILPGSPRSRGRIVCDCVTKRSLIDLRFLPGYSPEFNRAEYLN